MTLSRIPKNTCPAPSFDLPPPPTLPLLPPGFFKTQTQAVTWLRPLTQHPTASKTADWVVSSLRSMSENSQGSLTLPPAQDTQVLSLVEDFSTFEEESLTENSPKTNNAVSSPEEEPSPLAITTRSSQLEQVIGLIKENENMSIPEAILKVCNRPRFKGKFRSQVYYRLKRSEIAFRRTLSSESIKSQKAQARPNASQIEIDARNVVDLVTSQHLPVPEAIEKAYGRDRLEDKTLKSKIYNTLTNNHIEFPRPSHRREAPSLLSSYHNRKPEVSKATEEAFLKVTEKGELPAHALKNTLNADKGTLYQLLKRRGYKQSEKGWIKATEETVEATSTTSRSYSLRGRNSKRVDE